MHTSIFIYIYIYIYILFHQCTLYSNIAIYNIISIIYNSIAIIILYNKQNIQKLKLWYVFYYIVNLYTFNKTSVKSAVYLHNGSMSMDSAYIYHDWQFIDRA